MIPSYLTENRETIERVSRQHCQTARITDRAVLCRVLSKYIFYADADDIGLTPHLCLDGFWESWTTLAMARLIKPGWHCLDVGANQGYFTMLMADAVEDQGRVLAIEPNPKLAALLETSLEVNGFHKRAQVLQKALAETNDEKVELIVPRRRAMDATLCRAATDADEVIEVETVNLDRVTENWPRVDLIKIDAEGAEEAIWRGMRQTLRRNPSIAIIMEMRCARYGNAHAFIDDIQSAGFPLRHVDYDGTIRDLTPSQVISERPEQDWMLFLRRE